MSATNGCIACGHAFPFTRELASIPDAARVAFDPARRRAWRICAHCGEWNLLGPDAAAAALPELEARFSALTSAGESLEQFAPVHAGRLELLRVGAETDSDSSLALRLQGELRRRQRQFQRALWVFAVAVVAIIAGEVLIFGKHAPNWVALLSLYVLIQPIMLIDRQLAGRRVRPSSWLGSFVLVAIAAAAVGYDLGWRHLQYDMIGLVVAAPLILLTSALSRKRLMLAHVVADGGRSVSLSEADISELTLGWTDTGGLLIHDLPGGARCERHAGREAVPPGILVAYVTYAAQGAGTLHHHAGACGGTAPRSGRYAWPDARAGRVSA
jgi:hypothetical protein